MNENSARMPNLQFFHYDQDTGVYQELQILPPQVPLPHWSWHFVLDYAVVVAMIVAKVLLAALATPWTGWPVAPEELMYAKPAAPDLIPSWANALLSIVAPTVLMLVVLWLSAHVYRRAYTWALVRLDIHNACLGLFSSYLATSIVTGVLKNTLGQPRPNFLAGADTAQARTSFPSAHASIASMGYTFLILYTIGKLNMFSSSSSSSSAQATSFIKLALLAAFASVPVTVACTRVRDFSHFPIDVVVGVALGALISCVFYHSLFHWACWRPLARH